MKTDDPRHPWSRLTAAARHIRDERDAVTPHAFATRVAAHACERRSVTLLERFALRAVGLACLLAVTSVATNFSAIKSGWGTADDESEIEDPVVVLLAE